MIIIEDERSENYPVDTCENCGSKNPVRAIRAVGWVKEGRGWYMLCFACLGPRIIWKESENSRVFESPAMIGAK